MDKKFTVEKMPQNTYHIWDDFLKNSSQRNVFSMSVWLNIIAEAFGFKVVIYGCFRNSQLVGGCGLLVRKKYGAVISVPKESLMPYQSIILKDFDYKLEAKTISQNIQINSCIIEALQKDFDYISLIHHPAFVDVRPFLWKNWDVKPRYNFIITLQSKEKMYANLRHNILYDNPIWI